MCPLHKVKCAPPRQRGAHALLVSNSYVYVYMLPSSLFSPYFHTLFSKD